MEKNVTIIGAGLVGSLWAVYLSRAGYKVTIYERRSDIRKLRYRQESLLIWRYPFEVGRPLMQSELVMQLEKSQFL